MKKIVAALIVVGLLAGPVAATARASEGTIYSVRSGDTLFGIARRHGVTVSELARANGLHGYSWVYVGQRLTIPGRYGEPTQPSASGVYVVQPGDTLTRIAARHGVGLSSLAQANGLRTYSWVYVGQRLRIPGSAYGPSPGHAGSERWIDVNLTTQTLRAYEDRRCVYAAAVSTGLPYTPTPAGEFRIWVKFAYDDMQGPGYYLPDVPHVMYFYRGYGLHGTYWHNNFGTPMSHGCVNLSNADARWLFNWGSVGTRVVTHY